MPDPSKPPQRPLPRVPLNKYTAMLLDKPLDLFRTYAVSPPDAAVGDEITDHLGSRRRNRVMPITSRSDIEMGGTFAGLFRSDMGSTGEGFKHARVAKKIAWIQLKEDPVRHGALTFQAIIPSGADTVPPQHVPVWFLPWESRHLIEMTIPPRQNDDDDDPEDPKIFFTAGINGCSVFVRGDPRSPTVTHAGISQGQTPYGNDPATFWRHLLYANLAAGGLHAGKTWEINNTDYINQTGVSGNAMTANTQRYLEWLNSFGTHPHMVRRVIPWGCVFGIRYGRLWSFYLQENAVVETYKIVAKYQTINVTSKKTVLGPIKRTVHENVQARKMVAEVVSRINQPVRVSDFYPGVGSGKVNFVERWQRV